MQILFIILMVVFCFLLWLLVAPFVINVDSTRNHYEFQWKSIGYAKLLVQKEKVLLKYRVLFFKRTKPVDLFQLLKKEPSKKPKPKKKKKKPVSFSKIKKKIIHVFKSFTLEKFLLNIDTGSFYHNAFLYPIFYFIRGKNHRLNINYQGENEILLILKNRPIKLFIALFF